jgi:hypothetical protein
MYHILERIMLFFNHSFDNAWKLRYGPPKREESAITFEGVFQPLHVIVILIIALVIFGPGTLV